MKALSSRAVSACPSFPSPAKKLGVRTWGQAGWTRGVSASLPCLLSSASSLSGVNPAKPLDSLVDGKFSPLLSETLDAHARATVENLSTDFSEKGFCHLRNFLTPSCLSALQGEALALERDGNNVFRSEEEHGVALEEGGRFSDFKQRSRKSLIAQDRLPPHSPLLSLFFCSKLSRLLERIVIPAGEEGAERKGELTTGSVPSPPRLFPSRDPLGGVYLNAYKEGDSLGWHFDRSSFFFNLIIREPSRAPDSGPAGRGPVGGDFEFVHCGGDHSAAPAQRLPGKNRTERDCGWESRVEATLKGSREYVEGIPLKSGDALIFQGSRHMHRVTPVGPCGASRINAILTFAETEGMVLNEYTRKRFFGR
uniref:Fe2OG dioxygenase domain-containing protein n=1 Tax=Chromera velia CCMP2878 TaxID=1169474 RepID=A0A0G4G1L3_9ALVE|eukprot:Cvel_19824.t1-p1 / transcript=Cvel_19824.t1 / gene=Cvel_19824 / organism=Chromera_velia_CCMP2878 / gene_product=hypothetical protein / transcript_product=hypothetical protein / location=Cvel_scaffold1735:18803-22692(-) / protein_length=365 / sequence_SO=supercontig / SO=protein_coding / is_pseudo=false